MSRRSFERSLSNLSIDSEASADWDTLPTTPRNTVAFPRDLPSTPSVVNNGVTTPHRTRTAPGTPSKRNGGVSSIGRNEGTRTLSDILRKHADKEFAMDQEEATRVGDVLRGWVSVLPCVLVVASRLSLSPLGSVPISAPH
jgi:hypothetical protein